MSYGYHDIKVSVSKATKQEVKSLVSEQKGEPEFSSKTQFVTTSETFGLLRFLFGKGSRLTVDRGGANFSFLSNKRKKKGKRQPWTVTQDKTW